MKLQHLFHDIIDAAEASLSKGVRRIAPDAARVADGQAHEHTGQPGKSRFALDAAINLVDQQLARRLVG